MRAEATPVQSRVILRTVFSLTLFAVGTCVLVASLLLIRDLIGVYRKSVMTDDWAGFSLGLYFLLYVLFPSLGCFFIRAVLLRFPPDPAQRRLRARHETWRRPVFHLLWVTAVLLVIEGMRMAVGAWLHTRRYYPQGSFPWLQNAVLGLPLFLCAVVVAAAARRVRAPA